MTAARDEKNREHIPSPPEEPVRSQLGQRQGMDGHLSRAASAQREPPLMGNPLARLRLVRTALKSESGVTLGKQQWVRETRPASGHQGSQWPQVADCCPSGGTEARPGLPAALLEELRAGPRGHQAELRGGPAGSWCQRPPGHPEPTPRQDIRVSPRRGSSPLPGHLVELEAEMLVRVKSRDSSWGELQGHLTRAQGTSRLEASEIKAAAGKG